MGAQRAKQRATDVLQQIAEKVWRGELRLKRLWTVGLNTPAAVRTGLLHQVDRAQRVAPGLITELIDCLDWVNDEPPSLRDASSSLVELAFGDFEGGPSLLLKAMAKDEALRCVGHLFILQSLAGRLGCWAPGTVERADANTAKRLFASALPMNALRQPSVQRRLLEGERAMAGGAFGRAARAFLSVDSLVRTQSSIYAAAFALTHAGDLVGALWAARACLLEEQADTQAKAPRRLVAHLQRVLAMRANEPLSDEEQALLSDFGEVRESTMRISADAVAQLATECGPAFDTVRESAMFPFSPDMLLAAETLDQTALETIQEVPRTIEPNPRQASSRPRPPRRATTPRRSSSQDKVGI